ncbi:MAG: HEAT repeat domain-containing protein, partial [Polyangiaceae bacterium]
AAFLKTVVEVATSSTVQQLVERASGLDVDAKRDLILGLAQRGDPRFSEVLRAALRDEDEGTRNGAVQGLLQLGDESALADARRMARASDPNERAVAVDLFASHLDPATEVDVEALATDSDLGVVSSALHVLQARAPERILALAMRAFRAAPVEDRSSLLSNLSDLKSEVTRPLNELALREGGDDATAIQAIQALSALEGPESARRLLEVLSDTNRSAEVRSEAASGLRGLGGPLARANRALIDSLSEPADAGDFTCGIPG